MNYLNLSLAPAGVQGDFSSIAAIENEGKIFLEGNMGDLTKYYQHAFKKKDVRMCLLGSDFMRDVFATDEYNDYLTDYREHHNIKSKGAVWHSICVIDEFTVNKAFLKELGEDSVRKFNKEAWGPNYFIEEAKSEYSNVQHMAKKGLIRNYFVHEVA